MNSQCRECTRSTHVSVRLPRLVICLIAIVLFGMSMSWAEHDDDDDDDGIDRNWMLLVGAGVGWSPSFMGSDEQEMEFFPLIVGEYRWPRLMVYIEGDELGVTYRITEDIPLSVTCGLSLGESRSKDDDQVLAGSHDVVNYILPHTRLTIGEDVLSGNVQVRYAPLTIDGGALKLGLLYDLYLQSEIEAIPLIIQNSVGLCFMNEVYADAMFDAGTGSKSGLRSIDVSTEIICFFCRFAGIYLGGDLSYLVGSAADSPITERDLQISGSIGLFYML